MTVEIADKRLQSVPIPITVMHDVTPQRIADLLCGAFEGGSNYWIESIRYEYADGFTADMFKMHGACQFPDDYHHPAQIIPLFEGCSVWVNPEEDDLGPYRLDRGAIVNGLQLMAQNHPKHFADIVAENDDADTADVFLQCCLMGEVVFG